MRIALFHNHYHFRGGEDTVVDFEEELLRRAGKEVVRYAVHNDDYFHPLKLRAAPMLWRTPWSRKSYRDVRRFLKAERIDVGHVHNWFPVLSPSVHTAHRDLRIPVVQTLHNFRMGCAAATMVREGEHCDLCFGGDRSHAVKHGCYRGSGLLSRVWKRTVERAWDQELFVRDTDLFLAPSNVVAREHVRLGLPEPKVHVLPHACEDPFKGEEAPAVETGRGAIFVGRLSPEKGLGDLLEAWKGLDIPLTLLGSGPLEGAVREAIQGAPHIRWKARVSHDEVFDEIRNASFLVTPHRWNEVFGLTTIEAMACGRPVVTSDLGGPADSVEHDRSGLHVPAGDIPALRAAVERLHRDEEENLRLGRGARLRYEERFHPNAHVAELLGLLAGVIESRGVAGPRGMQDQERRAA